MRGWNKKIEKRIWYFFSFRVCRLKLYKHERIKVGPKCEKGGAMKYTSVVREGPEGWGGGKREASAVRGYISGIHEIIMVCIKCNLAKRMQRCIEA